MGENRFKVRDRVKTVVGHYVTGIHCGIVVRVTPGAQKPYGVHLDGEYYPDGRPLITNFDEGELEPE